jgi:tRNA(fMet)-specific endonuclease VapC
LSSQRSNKFFKTISRIISYGPCRFTSAITVAELSVGAHLSQRIDALEKTLELLSIVEIIDIDKDVAVEGGKIYSKLAEKGESIELMTV